MDLRALLAGARRGISHPNTDLDSQTFLLRYRQLSARDLQVDYRAGVRQEELDDPAVLIWDIGGDYDPQRGNFDHHQDFDLGATPIILLQALGLEPGPLDLYVDRVDRGLYLRQPQPYPPSDTLVGVTVGISLCHGDDRVRSRWCQELLEWVEESDLDPAGRFTAENLPWRFQPFREARLAEAEEAAAHAAGARWYDTAIGRVAFVQTPVTGTMEALYRRDAALVVLYDPSARFSGWRRTGVKFTIGANPAVVDVPGRLDLRPLFETLSGLEPSLCRWGGQAGIGGSPREEGGSALRPEQVMRELLAYLG